MKPAIRNAYIFVTLNAMFWGLTAVFVKMVLADMTVMQFIFYRMLIATIIAIPYVIISFGFVNSLRSFFNVRNLLVMLFSFGITTYFSSQASFFTTVILFTFVGALRPLIADILGAIFLKERIEKSEVLGTLIAFIGTLGLIYLQSLDSTGNISTTFTNNLIGVSFAILAAVLWIVSNILHKGVVKEERELVSHTGLILTFVIAAIIIAFTNPADFTIPVLSLTSWLALIFTGTFGASIAMVLFQKAIERIEVSEANLFYYLQVAITVPAAMLILNEKFELIMFVPLALIIFGIWLNLKNKLKKKHGNL